MFDRIHKRDGPYKVWGQFLVQEPSLMERFTHEAEVELFEITQSAVDQLR
jgi:hypothetical protein